MNLDLWRDIAGILLLIEAMILVLPILVLSFLAVRAVTRLRSAIANAFPRVHVATSKAQHVIDRSAEVAYSPVITVYSLTAGAKGVARGIRKVVRGKA